MERVAVVEVDVALRALLVRLLSAAGYQPLPLDVRGAAVAAPSAAVSAVVIDADGRPPGRAVAGVLPGVPAVVLASEPDQVPWREGRCEVVEKPFATDAFLDAVAAVVATGQ
jgi:FixJ family two-component response regulator